MGDLIIDPDVVEPFDAETIKRAQRVVCGSPHCRDAKDAELFLMMLGLIETKEGPICQDQD